MYIKMLGTISVHLQLSDSLQKKVPSLLNSTITFLAEIQFWRYPIGRI